MIQLENISFDHCIKCTVCTAYCPVARVTHLFPGPKRSGPDTERLRIKNPRLVDGSLRYCTNCKRCEIACPSDVRIADIIQTAKNRYLSRKFRVRDYFLSRTDLMGGLATRCSSLVNRAGGSAALRWALAVMMKVPAQRRLPVYAKGTFRRWYCRQAASQAAFADQVLYFHGCYVNYNDPELGRTLVRLFNALGVGVAIADEKCCGVPLIAGGYIPRARTNARFNIDALTTARPGADARIVATSSTCTYALKYEYRNLLGLDNAEVDRSLDYVTVFLVDRFERLGWPALKPLPLTAAYHAPCHLERMGGVLYTLALLRRIPGLRLNLLPTECCGISGTFGFKTENYPISQEIGQDLFRRVRAVGADVVITDCETCKWQLEENAGVAVVHPLSVLAAAAGCGSSGHLCEDMI
jgi:glycerol-3-phosphate dehydrogenase subunit C